MEASDITDEMLTAFLDGEADQETSTIIVDLISRDPDLAARLDALKIPLPAIREAFDRAMEAAPLAMVNEALDRRSSDLADHDRGSGLRKGLLAAVAASVLAFAIGLAAGHMILPPDSSEDWRIAVAEYQALYSKETLGSIEPVAVDADSMIQNVAAKIGAPLSLETLVALDRLTFKRAQILRWGSAPLAQFAFLSDLGEPFALCATPVDEADRPIENTTLKGLAVSSWVHEGIAYMVIGGSDPTLAATVAGQVRGQL